MASAYDRDLDRNPANFQPLTPLTFLERSAAVFPDHTAIIHGPLRRSYAEFYARADALMYEAKASGRNRLAYERLTVFNEPPAARARREEAA